MTIEKRIKLQNNIYFIVIDVEYKIKNNILGLYLKNEEKDYYDCGDLTILIEKVEKNYTSEKAKKYQENIGFLQDALYIYDRIPILSGIKDYYQKETLPYSQCYISKKELEQIIKENNIKMKDSKNFKLYDERTWYVE